MADRRVKVEVTKIITIDVAEGDDPAEVAEQDMVTDIESWSAKDVAADFEYRVMGESK